MNAKPWPYPLWIAHRGAGRLAPENTLAAFRVGASHGYRAFECDVKTSADGVLFLLHDDTLDRTTPARGVAGDLPWRELSLLDAGGWHSRGFAGEPLPSLEAVARFVLRNGHALNIEIKPTPGRESETGAAIAIDAAALWKGADLPPLLSSFSDTALAAARDAVPELPRAWLTEELPDDWIDRCRELGCIALDAKHTLVDESVVRAAHAAHLRVATWTVNEVERAAQLTRWGVDCVITDAVDRIAP